MMKTLALIFALMAIVLSSVNARTLKDAKSYKIGETLEAVDDIWGDDMADSPAPAPAPEPVLPAGEMILKRELMEGMDVPMDKMPLTLPTVITEVIEAEMAPAPAPGPGGAGYDDFDFVV